MSLIGELVLEVIKTLPLRRAEGGRSEKRPHERNALAPRTHLRIAAATTRGRTAGQGSALGSARVTSHLEAACDVANALVVALDASGSILRGPQVSAEAGRLDPVTVPA